MIRKVFPIRIMPEICRLCSEITGMHFRCFLPTDSLFVRSFIKRLSSIQDRMTLPRSRQGMREKKLPADESKPFADIDKVRPRTKQKSLKPLRFQAFYWSEWRDLNSRPLDPQSSALPTALHPVICLLLFRIGVSLIILAWLTTKCKPFFKKSKKFLN